MDRQTKKKRCFDFSTYLLKLETWKSAPPKELVRVFGKWWLMTSSQKLVKPKKRTYSEMWAVNVRSLCFLELFANTKSSFYVNGVDWLFLRRYRLNRAQFSTPPKEALQWTKIKNWIKCNSALVSVRLDSKFTHRVERIRGNTHMRNFFTFFTFLLQWYCAKYNSRKTLKDDIFPRGSLRSKGLL